MSKHTSGPWKARVRPGTNTIWVRSSAGDVVHWLGFDGVPQPLAERIANAHLIAAAPELAAALDAFGTWAVNAHDFEQLPSGMRDELKTLIERASAAMEEA